MTPLPQRKPIFFRVPRLLEELALARASGVYASLLGKLSRMGVLVLDDFLLNSGTDIERRDLLEVIEDRYDKTYTVITTKMLRPPRAQRPRAQGGWALDSTKESPGDLTPTRLIP